MTKLKGQINVKYQSSKLTRDFGFDILAFGFHLNFGF